MVEDVHLNFREGSNFDDLVSCFYDLVEYNSHGLQQIEELYSIPSTFNIKGWLL